MRPFASVCVTRSLAALAVACLAAACATSGRAGAKCSPDNVTGIAAGDECLVVRVFGAAPGNRTLVVFVHGGRHRYDRPMDYMAGAARRVSGRGVTAAVLIRPGYRSSRGRTSSNPASRNQTNWYRYDIFAVSDAIARLKAHHGAERVVLVGHSIGAAIAGAVLGWMPGLADSAVLLGCPCDMSVWRYDGGMSPSPHRVADFVPLDTKIVLLTGSADSVTPPKLARNYVAVLAKRGVAATFVEIDGAGHGIVNRPEVRRTIDRLARGG